MPKIRYVQKRFNTKSWEVVVRANAIIDEYAAAGYDLTLRQLYYQFVARGFLANSQKEYKRLGGIINDARLAGEIDWDHITDRTRNLHQLATWDSPADVVAACGQQFRLDAWATQACRPELWVEKEALSGVFQRVCDELRIPFFACRGYTSQSEMWAAAMRLKGYAKKGQRPFILHFGDHDPSGIDMTRDIVDRLELFVGKGVRVERMALNMDQVRRYDPPPNPAKMSDSRADVYVREYGDESWELDALDPTTLAALATTAVAEVRDDRLWEEAMAEERRAKHQLSAAADNWDDLVKDL